MDSSPNSPVMGGGVVKIPPRRHLLFFFFRRVLLRLRGYPMEPDVLIGCLYYERKVPFSMAIENMELMHECSPEHLRMGTARLK